VAIPAEKLYELLSSFSNTETINTPANLKESITCTRHIVTMLLPRVHSPKVGTATSTTLSHKTVFFEELELVLFNRYTPHSCKARETKTVFKPLKIG